MLNVTNQNVFNSNINFINKKNNQCEKFQNNILRKIIEKIYNHVNDINNINKYDNSIISQADLNNKTHEGKIINVNTPINNNKKIREHKINYIKRLSYSDINNSNSIKKY